MLRKAKRWGLGFGGWWWCVRREKGPKSERVEGAGELGGKGQQVAESWGIGETGKGRGGGGLCRGIRKTQKDRNMRAKSCKYGGRGGEGRGERD